jgi:CheY-like chemotaxis protein
MKPERRRTPRVQARGNVVVHAAGGVARCAIVNLSMGGVLLHAGEQRPALALAEGVALDVHLDGRDTAWLRTRGRVHRIDRDAFCVIFDDVSAAFEDAVEDEVLAEIESELRPRALVVDASDERAARLAAGLRLAGCEVRVAASPLEAIWWLEQSRAHVAITVISELASAGSLMSFLRDMHPGVVRAAIGDRPVGIGDEIERVFTDQPDLGDQLRRLVARVLVRSRPSA